MAEWQIDVATACEPYFIPAQPHWAGDLDGLVAITTRQHTNNSLTVLERGSGFVVAGWGEYAVVGAYFSPNRRLAEFESFLNNVSATVSRWAPRPTIFLGDLNAKAQEWGNRATDCRGRAVLTWAIQAGLALLNRGTVQTCVRHSGGSVVDLTFATPAIARYIVDWRVVEDVETLSDHLYIRFSVSKSSGQTNNSRTPSRFPRWVLSNLDRELAKEAAIVKQWGYPGDTAAASTDETAEGMRGALTEICDASMPRFRKRPDRQQVYWWTSEIAELRRSCNAARRAYVRCRRRNGLDPVLEGQLRCAYRAAKKTLQLTITQAKSHAREELLSNLSRDPWGRPYRAARSKLRAQQAPMTDTLPEDLLNRIMEGLFPAQLGHIPPAMTPPRREPEGNGSHPPVRPSEVDRALDRLRAKKTAPGPDGIPGRLIVMAAEFLSEQIRRLFDKCLNTGEFPKTWKQGRVCLLPKPGRAQDQPSAYRPIILLDEMGKLFERVLANRITSHLEEEGPGLSDAQYGFRAERSTIDALNAVKQITTEAIEEGEVVLGASLDVANAFNTLPFETIKEALRYHGVPPYLRRVLEAYLVDREVLWEGRDGSLHRRHVVCGVPQGSVLGPLLWNIGFDWILRGPRLPGLRVLCYADDTLVTARGENFDAAARRATVGVSMIVDRIERLGLKVALSKTEVLLFHGPRKGPPRGAKLRIHGELVPIKASMRYLGLVLDGRWSFTAHFTLLAPKLVSTAAALGRLLPNTGGPNSTCRHLYSGIIRSMALYGAPIWANSLSASNKSLLRKPQKVIAVRAVRGYRTISFAAATTLAAEAPWDLQAEVLASVHTHRSSLRASGTNPRAALVERTRAHAQAAVLQKWSRELETPAYGVETVHAIRPNLEKWVTRKHGTLTYRLVQVLTGHGCFGKYLHKIAGRELDTRCHECGAAEDTAKHTLVECPTWISQRTFLTDVIGGDLTLSSVVNAMLDSERKWIAVANYCEDVMLAKEAAERAREEEASADSIRHMRRGTRRRKFAHLLPP